VRRWLLVGLVAVVGALALTACGGASSKRQGGDAASATEGPTEAPSAEAPPFSVQTGLTADDALVDANLGGDRRFIVDVKSGLVLMLTPAAGATLDVSWRDSTNLLVTAGNERWLVKLDGSVRPWSASESSAPTPVPTAKAGRSPSGDWWALTIASGDGGVQVNHGDPSGPAAYRLTSAVAPSWPPLGGDVLAFNGNLCSGNDIMTFDPATGELQNLTANDPPALEYVWQDDGSALAAFVLDGETRRIDMIDARGGHAAPIISMPRPGELIPLVWSPDAGHLLFLARNTGRDFCSLDNNAPTPPPTAVERIGQ
jgi:hypothetical protein